MGVFAKDLLYGWRVLRRSPGFALVAVLTLALGVGANTAIFSVVDSVLLRPLAYRDADRVVIVGEKKTCCAFAPTNPPNLLDYQRRSRSFSEFAAYVSRSFIMTGRSEPLYLVGQAVTPNFFDVFGVPASLGRTLNPKLDGPGLGRSAVLSYGAWQKNFGADTHVIGSVVTLSGSTCTIVGVMPPNFRTPNNAEIWVSARFPAPEPSDTSQQSFLQNYGTNYIRPVAKLKPDVSIDQARAELETISAQLEKEHPDSNAKKRAKLMPALDWFVGNVRPAMWTLLAAVGLVLLIACSNVANLLLARGSVRQKEMAVRASVGASRGRIVRQLLTESTLLSFMGGWFGLLLAFWLVQVLTAVGSAGLPRITEVRLNPEVFLFALALCIFSGVVSGLAPAIKSSRADLNTALKRGARAMIGSQGFGLRRVLVVSEIALSLTLLIGAGLLIRSFARLLDVDPGFRSGHVITARIALPPAKYNTPEKLTAFYERITSRLSASPDVIAAGVVDALPFGGSESDGDIYIEGRPTPKRGEEINAQQRLTGGSYFTALQIPLLRGRYFTDLDTGHEPVVIVNQNLAKFAWPNEDAVGKRLRFGGNAPWMKVVGVVGNVHMFNLDERQTLDTYVPYRQFPISGVALAVRTKRDPGNLANQIRAEVRAIDPDQPVASINLLTDLVARSTEQRRFQMLLIGSLAALALVLATIGIYGVISYGVASRTQEIGVRVALGATSAQVLRLIFQGAISMAAAGVLVGVGLSLALGRFISSLLYDTRTGEPVIYVSAAVLLIAVSALASYLPARRAARVDPMMALREE